MAEEQVLEPAATHDFAMVGTACSRHARGRRRHRRGLDGVGRLRDRITHSLVRLDLLVKRARGRGLSLTTDWTPVRDQGVMTLLDADYTWGLLAGARGMRYLRRRHEQLSRPVDEIS